MKSVAGMAIYAAAQAYQRSFRPTVKGLRDATPDQMELLVTSLIHDAYLAGGQAVIKMIGAEMRD